MRNMLRKYNNMSYRSIIWDLRGAGMPEPMIQQTVENIKEYRKTRAKDRARLREADKQWGEIIMALQHERKIVRSMVRYETKDPAPEREEFVTHYFEVLNKLYDKLNAKRRTADDLPEHDHWVDYVPQHIKTALIDAANHIPRRDKAKLKSPFERKIPLTLFDLQRGRLQRATRKQLLTATDRLTQDPDNEKLKEQIAAMNKALDKLKVLELGEYVPKTWHGLVREEE